MATITFWILIVVSSNGMRGDTVMPIAQFNTKEACQTTRDALEHDADARLRNVVCVPATGLRDHHHG